MKWVWPFSWYWRMRSLEHELAIAKTEIRKLHTESWARESAHLIALNAAWSAACSMTKIGASFNGE